MGTTRRSARRPTTRSRRCARWCAPRSIKARSASRRASWSCTSPTTAGACPAITPVRTSSSHWPRCSPTSPRLDRIHPAHVPQRLRRGRSRARARDGTRLRRPVHLNTLTLLPHAPDGWSRSLEFAQEAHDAGLEVHPMFATNRQGAHFSLDSTFLFDEMPSFRDTLTLAEPGRSERLRDPAVRERMRKEIADPTGRSFVFVWQVVAVETWIAPSTRSSSVAPCGTSRRSRARTPSTRFLDLSLAEDLRMQFVLAAPPSPKRRAVRDAHQVARRHGRQLRRRRALALVLRCRLHDATHQRVDARCVAARGRDRAPHVDSRRRVRDHRSRNARNPGRPPTCCSSISSTSRPATRRVTCATSGGERPVTSSTRPAITPLIVNGETLLRDGADTGRRPGVVLRPGAMRRVSE